MKTNKQKMFLLPVLLCLAAASGCDRTPSKRTQKEIFIEAEPAEKSMGDGGDFFNQMPQDDIHRNLSRGNMPQDDIHAGLDLGKMPQDEIHGHLNTGNMPMAQSAQLEASMDKSPLRWKTPEGWFEKKGSGMRLATFTNDSETHPIETTIVSLAGSAGGLESNITRWMGQINLPVPEGAALGNFIDSQEKMQTASGWPGLFIDFTKLQPDATDDVPSMVAAVIDREQAQIFVKMTGSKKAVLENLAVFKSLVQSIAPAE